MVRSQHALHYLAAAGILLAVGCAPTGPADSAGQGVEALNVQGGSAGMRNDTPSAATTRLLERMAQSHDRTRYAGVRVVETHTIENGRPLVVEFREDAACDGEGLFSIDVIEVVSGSIDEDLFGTLQSTRQVFTHNYRDFRVTDLGLFRQNYTVRVLSNNQTVAGVPCLELRVDRVQTDGRYYIVDVEPDTGLVMRWVHRTEQGAVLGRMEFESIDFDPDLSNYMLIERNFGGQSVDIQLDLGGQAGFNVLTPNLLPAGFQLESARIVVGALERTWLQRVYTDGLSRLALMHREQEIINGPTDERNLGQVFSTQVGRWTVVNGTVQGWDLILMGQVEADDLYQMLQSAL